MIRKIVFAMAGALALASVGFSAHHIEHFQKAMKGVRASMKPANVAIKGGDMDALKKHAHALEGNFGVMAAYWEGRGTASALKINEEALEAVAALHAAAEAGDAAAAQEAMSTLGGTCKSCHSAHRTKNADGSFDVKK